jgi:hypothetical protein
VQTGVILTLTFLLAACGSVEVAKQSRSPGAPGDPLKPRAKPDPTAPNPAGEEVDPADRRETVLREWLEQATQDCDSKRDPEAYLPLREGVSKESVALVKARCMEVAEVALRGEAWRRALSACVDRFVKANGAGKLPTCHIAATAVPEVPPALLESHVAACTAVCAQAGPEALEVKNERFKPVICCDGTRSPTCTYGNKNLQGCCSGHQGVCIE